MNLGRMERLYSYVYSTPANSPERERRIEELSDEDQSELYDYAVGVYSGRITRPESGVEYMDTTNMSYEEWRALSKRVQAREKGAGTKMMNFELANPSMAQRYMQRSLDDDKKRSEIMQIKDREERWRAIAANIGIF